MDFGQLPILERQIKAITWQQAPRGPFKQSAPVTADGAVTIIPTPGHTPGHVSVLVELPDKHLLLAGDLSYDEHALALEIADGICANAPTALETMRNVRCLAAATPLVYLPSHDVESATRLGDGQLFEPDLQPGQASDKE